MAESWYVGAYWGPRRGTPDDAALRLSHVLTAIARADARLARWFEKRNRPTPRPNEERGADPETLARLLARGRNRNDLNGDVIDALGYTAALWNGNGTETASFSLSCGITSTFVPNSFVLNLQGWVTPEALRTAFGTAVDQFDPDWATATTDRLRTAQEARVRPVVGWLTYVKAGFIGPQRSDLSIATRARLTAGPNGGGLLVEIGDDPEAVSTTEVQAVARRLSSDIARQ